MNYPAASRGVSDNGRIPSEESELLRMELGVLLLPPVDMLTHTPSLSHHTDAASRGE